MLLSVAYAGQVDGGSVIDNAAAISLGEQYIGMMDDAAEEWFSFQAEEGSAYYRADFKNEDINTTLYMTAYDSLGIKIAETDAQKERSSYLSWKIVPGETYYLKFNRYNEQSNGRFTLSLTRTPDEFANGIEGAGVISVEQMILTSFDGSGDKDYMTFVAGEGQAYYRADFKNETVDTSVYMALLDGNGYKIAEENASMGYSNAIGWKAEAGAVYYLSFTRYNEDRNGAYGFTIDEIADYEPDMLPTDVTISSGENTSFTLGGADDTDWLRLLPVEMGSYTTLIVANTGSRSINVALTDSNGTELDSRSVGYGNDWAIDCYQSPGSDLYLRITGEQMGAYTVTQLVTPDIGGSTSADAAQLNPGESVVMTFEQDNDTDYAAFFEAGANILITVPEDSSLNACIVDANGQRISDEYWLYERDSYLLSADRSGVYLCLRGYGSCILTACAPGRHVSSGVWTVTKEATCTEEGEQAMLCTICGQYAEVQALSAMGHTPDSHYLLIKEAGCDDVGIEELPCKVCSVVLEKRTIPAVGHLNTYWNTVLEASCENEGLQQRICSDCGKQLEQERIPAFGHFAGEKTEKQPTCEMDGYTLVACRLCGEELERNILLAVGHIPGPLQVSDAAGCEETGLKESACETCGKVLEQESIPAIGHSFGDFVQVVAPTKDAEGLEESVCANCGAAQTRTVEKLSFLKGLFG